MNHAEGKDRFVHRMTVADDGFSFSTSIETALISAETETQSLKETIMSVESLRPNCDKLDYALAASSGALCGIIDIFLVGKPGESPAGNVTDKWFANRTTDFAKLCGWEGKGNDSLSSAINFLEKKFKIPYDQRGAGDAGSIVFDLTPSNHHFKSLGHNPTLIGLFFSILDQFINQSHFVSGGELISLQNADGKFELRGNTVPAKLFCGFVNWFGHLISDMSGASSSRGRGMGIPSPLWAWTNDIIAIKRKLNIPGSQFDNTINELALSIYKEGYDIRFQAAQVIPVFINEIIVRLVYAIRRLVKYFATTGKEERSASAMWIACEPFSNPIVKRMLTIAHGTFCMMDLGDATIRTFITGGSIFSVTEFFLRLNIVGVGGFTISLYGEAKQVVVIRKAEVKAQFARREITIVENYLNGLSILSELYDDKELVDFVAHFKNSDMYVQAFQKSGRLAELRKVPDNNILRTKSDIDLYFGGNRQ
ncbi:hypothetical protein [Bacillus altitudinis]|uniref:hypothetical protein n=1 Tax=Bacillus altitudinis TaxID=293387 RepID=UPI002DB83C83|nr:hypothetical protein [Bacillus altitudinis]MEC0967905.1 hypothetical protein [Bacillus altitudinis]MEC1001694.1 hypothetical protein [Bacillus altitudinis]